jgi:hypothetical protein
MVSRIFRAPRSINSIFVGIVAAMLFMMFALPVGATDTVAVTPDQVNVTSGKTHSLFVQVVFDATGDKNVTKVEFLVTGAQPLSASFVPATGTSDQGQVTALSASSAISVVQLLSEDVDYTVNEGFDSGALIYAVVIDTAIGPLRAGLYEVTMKVTKVDASTFTSSIARFVVQELDDPDDPDFSCDNLGAGEVDDRCDAPPPAPTSASVFKVLLAGETASVSATGSIAGVDLVSPDGVSVLITSSEEVSTSSVAGYTLLSVEVGIEASAKTPENPYELTFELGGSITAGSTGDIVTFRDGVLVPACTGATGVADPDPCMQSSIDTGGGNTVIKVLTSDASTWNFGVAIPPVPTATPIPPTPPTPKATATPIPRPVAATPTPVPPASTATPVPPAPTATPVPPTATPVPPTATPVPPAPTATPLPPVEEDDDGGSALLIIIVVVALVVAGGGGFLFLRRRGSN